MDRRGGEDPVSRRSLDRVGWAATFRPQQGVIGIAIVIALAAMLLNVGTLAGSLFSNRGYVALAVHSGGKAHARPPVVYDPPPINIPGGRQAEEEFRRALAWSPEAISAHAGLGAALILQGRYREATEAFDRAILLGGLDSVGPSAGNAHMFAGDRERALVLWLAGADDPQSRILLATTLFGQSSWDKYHPERWTDALRVIEETLKGRDLDPATITSLTLTYSELAGLSGAPARAEGMLRRALDANPANPSIRASLAFTLLSSGDLAGAAEEARTANAGRPSWRAHYVLGTVHLRRCELEESVREFRAGLTFRSDDFRYEWLRIGLGEAYWELGRTAEAIDAWSDYLRAAPDDTIIPGKIEQARKNELARTCQTG